MAKFCKFDSSKECFHDNCSIFDPIFGVGVCLLFRGGEFFRSRSIAPHHVSLVSKNLRRKGSGTFGWVFSVFLSVVSVGYSIIVIPRRLGFTGLFRVLAGVGMGFSFWPFPIALGVLIHVCV